MERVGGEASALMGTEAYGDQCCRAQRDPDASILCGSAFPLLSPDPLAPGALSLASGFRLSPLAHRSELRSCAITNCPFLPQTNLTVEETELTSPAQEGRQKCSLGNLPSHLELSVLALSSQQSPGMLQSL